MLESLTDITYEYWTDIDSNLQSFENYLEDMTCRSITNGVTGYNKWENDENDVQENDVDVKPPSNKEALEVLKRAAALIFINSTSSIIPELSKIMKNKQK